MHTIIFRPLIGVIILASLHFLTQPVFAQAPGLNLKNQSAVFYTNEDRYRKDGSQKYPYLFLEQPAFEQDTTMYWEHKPEAFNTKGKSVSMLTNGEGYLWGDSHEFDFDFPYSHFYYRDIAGNFTAETTVLLTEDWKYGNAGLLIKLSQSNWIKLYVGKEMDALRLNTVYTKDTTHMDYSTMPLHIVNNKIWLRITCNNGTLRLKYSTDGSAYETARILRMPANYKSAHAGLMADSPMSTGFEASFENFQIRQQRK